MNTRWQLYRIVCVPNGKTYVGVTHAFRSRIESHMTRPDSPEMRLDLRAYGREAFRCSRVKRFKKLERALQAEIEEIARMRDERVPLYNRSDGGEHPWADAAKIFDSRLLADVARVERQLRRAPRAVRQLALLPYRDMRQHAAAACRLAREEKQRALRERGEESGDDQALGAYVRHLRNMETRDPGSLYLGTDRMTPDEQESWAKTRGPVLRIAELERRCETLAAQWPDRDAWHRAYIATARRLARQR